ncbi:HAMP domain-containing histidine kinase [Clostridium sp. Sa3CUN1]|uniref:histidine kinase n=1 Tax=Clostridium gallinarum TaxID=2762246 RepID=A0ABR8Q6I9_9CLOT|nr:HAMP domain-containing sensor histidine kinase [Clostridium gallinarum]MBD7916015.1 HAMP domain-containing histidine kinase [Clostridium gallinarum]
MNKTLKGKLLIGSIVSVLVINIIFTVFISIYLNNSFKNSIIQEMNNIKVAALNIVNQNEIMEEPIWKSLSPINEIIQDYVGFSNENSKINQSVGKLINDEEIYNILTESNNIKSIIKFKYLNNSYFITYNYPIYIKDVFIANLLIQKDYSYKYSQMIKTIFIIISGQVLVVIALILTISLIINKSMKPLNDLKNSMKEFKLGKDIDDIEINSKDEISDLAKTYNLMKNKLTTQDKVLREFFNNATHELKTPITSISLYSQIFRDNNIKEMDDDFISRSSSRIVLECEKMKNLVEKILEASRGKINRNKFKNNFSLTELIEEIEEDFELRINDKNLNIKNDLQNISYYGVFEDFEQIFINLLDNSIKYSASKKIEIKLFKEEKNINLTIKNKILDIPEEIKDRLFEPFIKYNNFNDITKEVSSSGLGLYLCNELAKENNWNLSYDIIEGYIIFKLIL